MRSSWTWWPCMPRKSARMRCAACCVFSWGSFFSPGRKLFSRVRPSGKTSCVSTRKLSCPCGQTRRTTTSTTRTSFLCSVASSMRRAVPLRTSSDSSAKVFALPTPNLVVSMLCSVSIWENTPMSMFASNASGVAGSALASMSRRPFSRTFSTPHHSYTRACFGLLLPATVNFFARWLEEYTVLDLVSPALAPLAGMRLSCSMLSRSMSSCRRSCTSALTSSAHRVLPCSCFSSWPLVSCATTWSLTSCANVSGDLALPATHGCSMTSQELGRLFSFLSSMTSMNSLQVGWTLFGIFATLLLMSSSSLNGKRAVTKPNMMTPSAHTSTFRP
mmetsp:Transcript_86208/g.222033  ORF Transcript_86208/g.222033 Transcript_86208/m.222033 type:complete len:331 (+) Transcript_86208:1168-2160(+)